MEFTTPVELPSYPFRIGPDDRGLVVGSCFAGRVGDWLVAGKMPVCVNPFGPLYNPASVAQALGRLSAAVPFEDRDLFQHGGLWHSFLHHGDFSGADPEAVLSAVNVALLDGVEALRRADYLILTLGTAWVYERQGSVVANCHKLPAGAFVRRRLTVGEIVELLSAQIERWPDKQVVLTVSPVVHRGDGLVENQLSKSTLIVAVQELVSLFPGRVHYFPAYEIVTGELRDYRYYAEDLCHPSAVAVAYVRERFADALLSAGAVELMAAAEELNAAMAHRPRHPQGAEYDRFRAKMRQKAESIQRRYKNADFGEELRFFG